MSSRSPKILVEVLSDNPRSRNTIEFAIQRHGKGRMDVGQSSHSHLAVVDYEGASSREDLRRYHQRYPQRPVVLMMAASLDRNALGEDLATLDIEVVVKPLKVDDLIGAIEKCAARGARPEPAAAKLEASRIVPEAARGKPEAAKAAAPDDEATLPLPGGFMGAAEGTCTVARRTTTAYMRVSGSAPEANTAFSGPLNDIDLADPAAVDRARIRAGGLLLGRLKDALGQVGANDAALQAEVGSQPVFRFLPGGKRVTVLVAQEALSKLAVRPIPDGECVLRPVPEQTDTADGTETIGIEALLWRLALLTYRGRIPEETDPLAPVYLARWPNVTRLDPVPDSLRIAALWSRMPVDLGRTARTLSVPQKHVFLFYAAALTVGLVGPERRASNYLFKPDSPHSVAPPTLLAHLAEYLSHGGGAPAEDQK